MGLLSFVYSACSAQVYRRSPMTCSAKSSAAPTRPILVADVMDTLVTDPFFNGMQSYFGFDTFKEFLGAKTPGLWVDFEKGRVDEHELGLKFFKHGRSIDVQDFKQYLKESYTFIPGVESMLDRLREADVDIHLCSNYPDWSYLIEETLHLHSRFGAKWTFVSGREGIRKPERDAFLRVAEKANTDPSACVLLDDRSNNCEGAMEAGYLAAILFENADQASSEIAKVFTENGVLLDFAASRH